MATLVQILGPEGSGKTYSAKDLDPKTNFWINADMKNLPFPGWRKSYNAENKNYVKTSDGNTIIQILKAISEKRPEIKSVMVDTVNSIMSDKEMSERKKSGYDKWMDLAGIIYDLYSVVNNELRDDLTVFMIGHVETYDGPNGEVKYRLKTNGAKLTKLNVEGKCTYTLYTSIEAGKDNIPQYYFLTQSDGSNTARSAAGCLDYKIPNNLNLVLEKISIFENG